MTVHTADEADTRGRRARAAAAARRFGGPATIERLRRESGGASRQTWSFDALVGGQRHGADPAPRSADPRQAATGQRHVASTAPPRFRRAAGAAHGAGVRAPEVLFELTPQDGLGEAFVMRRIGGMAIARKLLRDPPYERRAARRSRASSARSWRASTRSSPADLPALAASRGGRPRSPACARALDALEPAAAGVRAGAVLARPAQARPDRHGRCWCMATTAPATISPTRAA